MKQNVFAFTAGVLGMAAMAYAQAAQAPATPPPAPAGAAAPVAVPHRIAVIKLQEAIIRTKDGEHASAEMQAKFGARKQALEKQNTDLQAMQEQLNKGAATMADAAKQKMAADIATGQKRLQRDGEDFDAEVQAYESNLMQDLGTKLMDVVIKYASQNGFAMVVDVSSQQSPVLWADQGTVITETIVKLYDQAHPGTAATAAAPPAVKPVVSAPPAKKQ